MTHFTKMTETCLFGNLSVEYTEDFCECVVSKLSFATSAQDNNNTYMYRLSNEEADNLSQVCFEGELYTDSCNMLKHVIKKFVEEHATIMDDSQRHIFILNKDFVVGNDPEIKVMNEGHEHGKFFHSFWIRNLSLMDT